MSRGRVLLRSDKVLRSQSSSVVAELLFRFVEIRIRSRLVTRYTSWQGYLSLDAS